MQDLYFILCTYFSKMIPFYEIDMFERSFMKSKIYLSNTNSNVAEQIFM